MNQSIKVALLSLSFLTAASAARGQTCAAPIPWQSDPLGEPAVAVDLCAASDEVALYCDFLDSANKPDVIWLVEIAEGYTSTAMQVNGASAGFNPVLYLYSGPCSSGAGCVRTGDQGSPMSVTGLPPGKYFLAATAAPADAGGACGPATIATNGWLPVTLQDFMIE